jgi:hypothetical protein
MAIMKKTVEFAVVSAAILVFAALDLAHAFGPLRLRYDSAEYLAMAAVHSDGHPFPDTRLPVGYPLVVEALDRVGLANSGGLVGFNVTCLLAGLAVFGFVVRREFRLSLFDAGCLVVLSLASRLTIDLVSTPQPEMAFFLCSMATLACLSLANRGSHLWIMAATIAAALSLSLRTAGLALFPAILWTAIRLDGLRFTVRKIAIGCVVAAASAAASALLVKFVSYSGYANSGFVERGTLAAIAKTQEWRLEELAQIFANVGLLMELPRRAFPGVVLLGIAGAAAAAIGLWTNRRSATTVYVLGYVALLSVYAFYAPRLWVPAVPLVFAAAMSGCKTIAARSTWPEASREALAAVYGLTFTALGLSFAVSSLDRSFHADAAELRRLANDGPPQTTAQMVRFPDGSTGASGHRIAAARYGLGRQE